MHHGNRGADDRSGTTADHRNNNRRHYQQQQHYNYFRSYNNQHDQQHQNGQQHQNNQQHHNGQQHPNGQQHLNGQQHRNNQHHHRNGHYGGRWTGGGDERWPAEARPQLQQQQPRRNHKKFSNFRKFDDGGGPEAKPSPPRFSQPSGSPGCYRGTVDAPVVNTVCETVEWGVVCKHFSRLNQNENGNIRYHKAYPPLSIPQNHHLHYYSDLQQLHHVSYATRNMHTHIGKKQRPQSTICNPWEYKLFNKPIYAFGNKYCLSAPEMYASHAKDVAWDDSQIVLDKEDQLSSDMWRKYLDSRQSERVYDTKMTLWRKLSTMIKNLSPKCGLYMVGSTMNGFGGDVSDADFCLLTDYSGTRDEGRHMCGIEQLRWMSNLMESSFDINQIAIVYAKVPILHFQWTATDSGNDKIAVDLCCNHMVGIRNTHLLYCYSRLDYRVRPLVLTIKLWASNHNINDPKKMTLSSYSLVLMVINFLQCVEPVVVPSLQHIYGMKFSMHTDIEFVHMHEKLPRNSWRSDNKQTLGELLLQFFEYYNNFNYCEKAVSVRTGGLLSLEYCRIAEAEKNDPGQWKFIGIEEPFERTNTARSVHNHNVFNQIKEVISKSYNELKKTKSLNSIFCQFGQ